MYAILPLNKPISFFEPFLFYLKETEKKKKKNNFHRLKMQIIFDTLKWKDEQR
jgi:hypothetical protein